MPPPKRAVFSLNLDSSADHVHERVEDGSEKGTDRFKVIESKGPTTTHSDIRYVAKPFENLVNRTVNDVLEGSGKKVNSAEGQVSYSTRRSEKSEGKSRLNVVSKLKRRSIEEKYDTSEL